jgi:hypothetical protein
MNENLKETKPREQICILTLHLHIMRTLCNTLIITCPLIVTKSSFMRMNDHFLKSFFELFVQWGKMKIPHHILKRHGFGIKVL